MQQKRSLIARVSLSGTVALGVALGLGVASARVSAQEEADKRVRNFVIDPSDPAFAPLFAKFPNAGLIVLYDTEKDGVDLIRVRGRSEDATGLPLTGTGVRDGRLPLATVAQRTSRSRCKWRTVMGEQVLVSGNPSQCRD